MKALIQALSIVFSFSLVCILLLFILNPILIRLEGFVRGRKKVRAGTSRRSVSLLVAVHNAGDMIEQKIKNSLSLDYPSDAYEIVIASDGSSDDTDTKVRKHTGGRVTLLSFPSHRGKISALNDAVPHCSGDIIVFSDVDAILQTTAVTRLASYLEDPDVGGVCGRRVIVEDNMNLMDAQSDYIRFDSSIKELESRSGSISSNDGKLYAIRKSLFQDIPPAVTDDLFVCLSVVGQGYRFVFEPDAHAYIRMPSRNPAHEVSRRRRIVAPSLRGIWLQRGVLNPLKHGLYAVRLFVNKVIRRFLPVFLVLLFLSSAALAVPFPLFWIILSPQILFYLLALSYWAVLQRTKAPRLLIRSGSAAFYFCVGNYGTLLGLADFFLGREITKWEPVKHD